MIREKNKKKHWLTNGLEHIVNIKLIFKLRSN